MRVIALMINAGEKMCGECAFKIIHHTGLIGETHPKCVDACEQVASAQRKK